jgi:hypothetical protein
MKFAHLIGLAVLTVFLMAQDRFNNEVQSAVPIYNSNPSATCQNWLKKYGFADSNQPLYWSCVKVPDIARPAGRAPDANTNEENGK